MPLLELPHTAGCLVCGRDNPHGLHLSSQVDPDSGNVRTTFTPAPYHIGFENIIHGGVLATVLDEIMVWSAIWATKKACVAAELSLRFIERASIGKPLTALAMISRQRSRLIETNAELCDHERVICTATGKYIPLGPHETAAFHRTFVKDPTTAEAAAILMRRSESV
jgi:acyl-coenzyme A thioesterase PaaI-like protein